MNKLLCLFCVSPLFVGCATSTSGSDDVAPPKAPGMASCAIQGDEAQLGGRVTWSARLDGAALPTGLGIAKDGSIWLGAVAQNYVQFTCADESPGQGDSLWVGAVDPSGALRFQSRFGAPPNVFGNFAFDVSAGVGVMTTSTELDGLHPNRFTSSVSRIASDGTRTARPFLRNTARWEMTRVSVGIDGTTYVIGDFHGTLRFGADMLQAERGLVNFVGAISRAGEPLWARTFSDSSAPALPALFDLAALPGGGVAVIGQGKGAEWQGHVLEEIFVAKLDATGAAAGLLERDWKGLDGAHLAADAAGDLAFSFNGRVELVDASGDSVWRHELAAVGPHERAGVGALALDSARRVSVVVGYQQASKITVDGASIADVDPEAGSHVLASFAPDGSLLHDDVIPIGARTDWAQIAAAPDGSLVVSAETEATWVYLARFPAP